MARHAPFTIGKDTPATTQLGGLALIPVPKAPALPRPRIRELEPLPGPDGSGLPPNTVSVAPFNPGDKTRTIHFWNRGKDEFVTKEITAPDEIPEADRDRYFEIRASKGASKADASLVPHSELLAHQQLKTEFEQRPGGPGERAEGFASTDLLPLVGGIGGALFAATPPGRIYKATKPAHPFLANIGRKAWNQVRDRFSARFGVGSVIGAGGGEGVGETLRRVVTDETEVRDGLSGVKNELINTGKSVAEGAVIEGAIGSVGKAANVARRFLAPDTTKETQFGHVSARVVDDTSDPVKRAELAALRHKEANPTVLALSPAEQASKDAKQAYDDLFTKNKREREARTFARPNRTISATRMAMDASGKVGLSTLRSFMEGALQDFPGVKIFHDLSKINKENLDAEIKRFVGHIEKRGGLERVAQVLVDEVQGLKTATRAGISQLYKRLDSMTKGISLDPVSTRDTLNRFISKGRVGTDLLVGKIEELDAAKRLGGPVVEPVPSFYDRLTGTGRAAPEALDNLRFSERVGQEQRNKVSFQEMAELRSSLLAFGREAPGDAVSQSAKTIANSLVGAINIEIDTAVKAFSPEARRYYAVVNAYVKRAHKDILTGFVAKGSGGSAPADLAIAAIDAIGKDVGKAADVLLTPHNAQTLAAIKLVAPNSWNRFKEGLTSELLLRATPDVVPGVVSGGPRVKDVSGIALSSNIKALGEPMMVELLGKEGSEQLARLASAMKSQEIKPRGLGSTAMSLTAAALIASPFTSLLDGDNPTAEVVRDGAIGIGLVTLAPRTLARLLRSPPMMRAVAHGFEVMNTNTAAGLRILSRVSAKLAVESQKEDTQLGRPPLDQR